MMGSCEDTTVFTSVLPHLLSQLSNLLYLSLSLPFTLSIFLFSFLTLGGVCLAAGGEFALPPGKIPVQHRR